LNAPVSPASLGVRVITPHSGVDAFTDAIRSIRSEFSQARGLAWRFFLRDTRADHRQSLLGYFWLVVPAVANALTWIFLNNQKVVSIDSGSVSYPVFVLTGTILWTAFNSSMMAMLGIVNSGRAMLSKVNFPHEALVYTAMLKSTTDSVLAALLLIPIVVVFHVTPHVTMLLFPLALAGGLVLGWSLGLVMIPIAALYGDVSRAIQLVLRFGFFLTPVVFALPPAGLARKLMLVNPVTPVIVSGRAWLAGSADAMPAAFAGVVAGSVMVGLIALVFYKVALPHLIERLGG
jgi:lipopolysaccharide transport system permease protein